MPFFTPDKLPKTELFTGATSTLITGDQVMLSFLEMEQGAEVPEHSHVEEQAGLMLEGELLLRIGDEEKLMRAGEAYIVPSGISHSGVVVRGPIRILDVFGPPREDYKAKAIRATESKGDPA